MATQLGKVPVTGPGPHSKPRFNPASSLAPEFTLPNTLLLLPSLRFATRDEHALTGSLTKEA